MARKKRVYKREINPDPVYQSELLTRLINKLMLEGKRGVAESIVYGALAKASEKLSKKPLEVLSTMMDNAVPLVEVRSRRVGGSTYQVPREVSAKRQVCLALRWLVQLSRLRPEKTMVQRLTNEIVDICNKTGRVIKKREEIHRMSESNKAFVHFRW